MDNMGMARVYKKRHIETLDQLSLIVMCYDEAIKSLQRGKELSLKNEFKEKALQFNKAVSLISELLSSLNIEEGGAIARNLSSTYQFFLKRILYGDIKNDMKAIDEVIVLLFDLKSVWEKIGTQQETHQKNSLKKPPERMSISVGA